MSDKIFTKEKRNPIEAAVAPYSLTVSEVANRGISVGSL